MKPLFTKYILISIALIITSCEGKDQDIIITELPKTSKFWGFFRGTVNEKKFDIINHRPSNADSIYSIKQIINDNNTINNDRINDISTGIMLPNRMKLNINIRDLDLGNKKISLTPIIQNNESYIKAYWDEAVYYKPKGNNTFIVEIIKIDWESKLDPIMEVKIKGYLFNNTDTNDSIYINAIYGTR